MADDSHSTKLPKMAAGQRYGQLVAICHSDGKYAIARWLFKCDCGNYYTARCCHVRAGKTKSCGHWRLDRPPRKRPKPRPNGRHGPNVRTERRRAAKEQGLQWYDPGKPCKRGHLSVRSVANGQCRECKRIAFLELPSDDYERYKMLARSRNSSNPELRKKKSVYGSAWKKANKEAVNTYSRNRRTRIKGQEGSHSVADITDIRRLQKDRCAMPECRCNLRGKGHVDHITPIASGGSNYRSNLQLLCAPCNYTKATHDMFVLAKRSGRLL